MAIIQDWKINATSARCELTQEPFADGQVFYTCIFADPESGGFLRRDYAVESWEKARAAINPPPFSFWKSTYKAPVAAARDERLADTSVEGMLRRFIEEDDPRTENARFILALMLERKKVLVPVDAKETETRKLLFYEHGGSGEVFIVADPGLKLTEIEAVQIEVSQLLSAEEQQTAGSVPGEGEEEGEEVTESEEDSSEEGGEESAQPE